MGKSQSGSNNSGNNCMTCRGNRKFIWHIPKPLHPILLALATSLMFLDSSWPKRPKKAHRLLIRPLGRLTSSFQVRPLLMPLMRSLGPQMPSDNSQSASRASWRLWCLITSMVVFIYDNLEGNLSYATLRLRDDSVLCLFSVMRNIQRRRYSGTIGIHCDVTIWYINC